MRFFKTYRAEGEWHKWFAWHPVWAHERSGSLRIGIVWLEYVMRRRNDSESIGKYSYKVI